MNAPGRHVYSPRRLRIVLVLLSLVTLPVVVGTAVLIYHYMRFSVMVEKRLANEHALIPSRVYARPLRLREGMPLTEAQFVKALNALKYEQRLSGDPAAGEFVHADGVVSFLPRSTASLVAEPLIVAFEKDRVREIRGAKTRKKSEPVTLDPVLVTYLFDASREKRLLVRYEELPTHLVEAVLAIEDRRFFQHPGLDPIALTARVLRNLRTDSAIPYGGSTITQQLCKNFFLTPERTAKRKIQEGLLALALERRATKKDILELYLNEIYLGRAGSFSINGVGQAARAYFRKDVQNLTLPEAALVAGMIQSPNPYNPNRHPDRAMERRNAVIRAMQDAGFIDEPTMKDAEAAPLRVEASASDSAEAPYFVDFVRNQLAQRYALTDLTTGNLSIQTTIDLPLQQLAQRAVETGLAAVDKQIKVKRDVPVQASLIAIEPKTGEIVALVGGRSYDRSQYDRVVRARRQPGSTFKPFVYLSAFEATFDDPTLPPITPATVVEDAPAVFFYEDKEYIPQNYEDKYFGYVTLRKALAHSLNVATVKVAEMVGYDRVAAVWTQKLRISDNVQAYPAIALGAFEATPLQMATAYSVLANGGLKIDPVAVLSVTDGSSRPLEQHNTPTPERVVHEESAFLVTHMLRSTINEGTAASARAQGFAADAAGKTGTSNDKRDAWFAGYTPDLLCVVWVGYDDNTPIGLTGASAALPIWVEFMKGALAGTRTSSFLPPEMGIVFEDIDKETGLLAGPSCPKIFSEAFIATTEPTERCAQH